MEASCQVSVRYTVVCPYCQHKAQYQDFLSNIDTNLHSRLLEILLKQAGDTNIFGVCKECCGSFTITTFKF